jgi:Zn-dependent protease
MRMKILDISSQEAKDVLISALALIFIFSYPDFLSNPSLLLMSALVIFTGFIFHEFAHRTVARKFNCYAHYRMWPEGLMLAVALSILTGGNFAFAAPGAVMIYPKSVAFGYARISRKESGLISISGPATNTILALAFILINMFYPNSAFLYAAYINTWLAMFNMIPFPPLDGSKIFYWNKGVWLALASILGLVWVFLL